MSFSSGCVTHLYYITLFNLSTYVINSLFFKLKYRTNFGHSFNQFYLLLFKNKIQNNGKTGNNRGGASFNRGHTYKVNWKRLSKMWSSSCLKWQRTVLWVPKLWLYRLWWRWLTENYEEGFEKKLKYFTIGKCSLL